MTKTTSALVLTPRPEQSQEEVLINLIKQIENLFQVKAGFVLQVSNYYELGEQQKQQLCAMFLPATLCKVPARVGNGVLFFLSKEARA